MSGVPCAVDTCAQGFGTVDTMRSNIHVRE